MCDNLRVVCLCVVCLCVCVCVFVCVVWCVYVWVYVCVFYLLTSLFTMPLIQVFLQPDHLQTPPPSATNYSYVLINSVSDTHPPTHPPHSNSDFSSLA